MDDHYRFKKLREQAKKENDEKYRFNSKKRLLSNVSRKFQTTMIGSLAAFEKRFGHLWENDPGWRRVWEETRTDVLDLGNKSLRAAEQEISEYTITWDRYQTEFKITTKENSDGNK
jgi:hypothetical protein